MNTISGANREIRPGYVLSRQFFSYFWSQRNYQSNVKENKSCPGGNLLPGDHSALPGLYGNVAWIPGMDGEGSVPSGRPGLECCRHRGHAASDDPFRKGLLFGNMPPGRFPGRCRMAQPQGSERKVHVLQGSEVAPLRGLGALRRGLDSGNRFLRRPSGSVQRLGQDSPESPFPCLSVGEQYPGGHCREAFQLRLLFQGSVAAEPADVPGSGGYLRRAGRTGMEERQDLLQHRVPCRHHLEFLLPLCHVPPRHRCREVPQLPGL